MKKIFSILAVAAVVLSMASCALGGSDRYKDGSEPNVDYVNHKVNNFWYDEKTERCWLVYCTVENVTTSYYTWTDEFSLVVSLEWDLYYAAQAGKHASYKLMGVPDSDDDCMAKDDYIAFED